VNPSTQSWISEAPTSPELTKSIASFHSSLPRFKLARLISLGSIAKEIGVKSVYLKDEGNRWDLPSFKILGASWAINRAIVKQCGLPDEATLEDLGAAARNSSIRLVAATDGNHGRAVSKMARVLGIGAPIYVPKDMDSGTRDFIIGEGSDLIVVDGDYDSAVRTAAQAASTTGGWLVQDTAFEGYEEIPKLNC
jgi:diaminopropionate ammonia-lyase family